MAIDDKFQGLTRLDPEDRLPTWTVKLLDRAELYVATTILLTYTVITLGNVILNATVGIRLPWGQGLVIGLFIWTVWLAAAHVVKEGNHLRFTGILKSLSPRGRYAVMWVEWLLWLLFAAIVFQFSLEVMGNYQSSGAMVVGTSIPKWLMYLSLPVGMALIILRTLQHVVVVTRDYRAGKDLTEHVDLEA